MKKREGIFILSLVLPICAVTPAFGDKRQRASISSVFQAGKESFAAADANSGTPKLERRNPRYRVSQGDILQIDFPLSPEFNRTVTVAPDGYITLMAVGDVYVRGLTVPELRQTLRKAYSGVLHQPIISITLKDFQRPYVVVGGQVGKPGKYDLRGQTTVLEALQIAGGISDSARHSQVLLFRHVSSDWVEVKKLDVKRMLRGQDLAENIELQAGDMLFVPKSTIAKIARFIPVPGLGMYMNGL